MDLSNYSEEQIDELDKLIIEEFNQNIFEELTDKNGRFFQLFEPLEFFELFYSQIKFVEENQNRPLFVTKSLQKLSLKSKQKYMLFDKITEYLDENYPDDDELGVCNSFITKLKDSIDIQAENKKPNNSNHLLFDFAQVKKHLDTLASIREKIAYLIEIKTAYEQQDKGLNWEKPTFSEKCSLEINKLSKLSQLKPSITPTVKEIKIEVGKHKDLTIDRVIFLLNRLIPSFQDCDATKKSEFINFLTGFDYETARQRFSSIHKKEADKPQAFEKDMEIVCKYLDLIGRHELVREIKKDLLFK